LHVEIHIHRVYPGFDYHNPPKMNKYRPFCDFAPWATCRVVLMSPPGRFLRYFGIAKFRDGFFFDRWSGNNGIVDMVRGAIDIPNPTLGVIFFGFHFIFPVLMVLPFPLLNQIIVWAFFGACCGVGLMTIWLAYNLFFVLKDFCVVCVSMYVANFALIPMMYKLATTSALMTVSHDQGWLSIFTMNNLFDGADILVWAPILAMVAVMGSIALFLYFWYRNSHHDESSEEALLKA